MPEAIFNSQGVIHHEFIPEEGNIIGKVEAGCSTTTMHQLTGLLDTEVSDQDGIAVLP
jgi:hypothetical protein